MERSIALFSIFVVSMLLTVSCEKYTPTDPDPTPTVYDRTGEKDVISQTIDAETYVIGKADEEGTYAGSVFSRLANCVGTFDKNTTKAVVIFNCSGLSQSECLNVFNCFDNGGAVIIVNPDAASYDVFREKVAAAAKTLLIDKYNTVGIDEEKWLTSCKEKLFNCASLTYGTGKSYDCLAFCNKDRFLCPRIYPTAGAAQYGQAAEALARWLSGVLDRNKQDPFTVAEKGDLNQIPEISSEEYVQSATISCASPKILGGKITAPYADVVNVCVRWSLVFAPTFNRDYYYIDESVTANTPNLEPVPDASNHKKWHCIEPKYEIAYLDGMEGRIEMSMRGENGEKLGNETADYTILQYHPHSTNETFQAGMTTEPAPVQHNNNVPGTFGTVRGSFAGEFDNFKEAFAGSVKQNTVGFDCTVGEQCDISGIFVNSETRWNFCNYRYIGKGPTVAINPDAADGEQYTWEISPLLLSNCNQHNSFYIRTNGLSAETSAGMPMLHLSGTWKIRSISQYSVAPYWQSYDRDIHIGQHDDYIELGRPYRHVEQWTLDCYEYGDLTEESDKQEFEKLYVNDLCPEVSGKINYVAGFNADDVYEANLLFNQFMADFESKSKIYADKGFKGKFVFSFQGNESMQILYKTFTIK